MAEVGRHGSHATVAQISHLIMHVEVESEFEQRDAATAATLPPRVPRSSALIEKAVATRTKRETRPDDHDAPCSECQDSRSEAHNFACQVRKSDDWDRTEPYEPDGAPTRPDGLKAATFLVRQHDTYHPNCSLTGQRSASGTAGKTGRVMA